jgi:hypothetical protein
MIVDKYGNYVRKFMWELCGQDRVDICLTVHSRAILKIVKSMCNAIKKSNARLRNVIQISTVYPTTQLPHKFSYVVAILIHNHFESPNITIIIIKSDLDK